MPAEFDGVIDGLGIPTRRNSRGKQCFNFRCEIKRFLVEGIEERLDTEAIAGGEDRPINFIPEYKGEFAAQSVQALRPEIFIEMKSDLAVGPGAQAVTRAFELALNRFIAIEFAVDDDAGLFVLAGDRLISGGQINDAETRVTEGDAAVERQPVALPIGAAMIEPLGSPLQHHFRDRITAREEGDYAAHADVLLVSSLRSYDLNSGLEVSATRCWIITRQESAAFGKWPSLRAQIFASEPYHLRIARAKS